MTQFIHTIKETGNRDTNVRTTQYGTRLKERDHRDRYKTLLFSLPVALRSNAGHGLLIPEVSRSHTTTHHIR